MNLNWLLIVPSNLTLNVLNFDAAVIDMPCSNKKYIKRHDARTRYPAVENMNVSGRIRPIFSTNQKYPKPAETINDNYYSDR